MYKPIVGGLLTRETGAVFATTDDPFVDRNAAEGGFFRTAWQGQRGDVSLWLWMKK